MTPAANSSHAPRLSVVIAAYNSSAKLTCAVRSALAQSEDSIEILVIGDGVTDNSEQALSEIGDFRISWENLPRNWGEQSVASNRGLARSKGDFVAFLNQDDLWLSQHAMDMIAFMNQASLDVCVSPYLVIRPGSTPDDIGYAIEKSRIAGCSRLFPRFDPRGFYPASAVMWRADALRQLGGWRTAADTRLSPSQDLVFRAFKSSLRVGSRPSVTCLVLWSGTRVGSYTEAAVTHENQAWLDAILHREAEIRREISQATPQSCLPEESAGLVRRAARALRWWRMRLLSLIGIHPRWQEMLKQRPGDFINRIRAANSLPPINFSERKRSWFAR